MHDLFGVGAMGEIIKRIQTQLTNAGYNTQGIDGWFGNDTVLAVQAYQRAQSFPPSGVVDDVTWQPLMSEPVPPVAQRALQLTASFEAHGFELAEGNFDGGILTWGIIGFTMLAGEVQSIVLTINQKYPDKVREAFGNSTDELLRTMRATPDQQKTWANSLTLASGALARPWRDMFAAFGAVPEVQQEQLSRVQTAYMQPAIQTARRLGMTSELGLALCFDIHVQDGSIKPAAMQVIQQQSDASTSEADLRKIVANAVADLANTAWREDVRSRKLTVATGQGRVHGHNYSLINWGLDEGFAADELTQLAATA